jgi:diguanylate cyclase (GGDEF)-like protein
LNLNDYTKAFNYLKKLEEEIANDSDTGRIASLYHFLKFYYSAFVEPSHLSIDTQSIEQSMAYMDVVNRFEVEGLKLLLQIKDLKTIVEKDIIQLIKEYDSYDFYKEKRTLLLDTAAYFVETGNMQSASILLSIDQGFMDGFDSMILQHKRRFISSFFSKNKTESFEVMLKDISGCGLLELEWKILRHLGEIYFENEDYYKSVNAYIASLDILRRLTSKVPKNAQLSFINNDRNKRTLKHKIEVLKQLIIMDTRTEENTIIHENVDHVVDLTSFFDFSHLQTLFHNQKFLAYALKEYSNLLPSKINNLKDLVGLFSSEYKENIEFVLKYCVQVTLATRGFIILTDELGATTEFIKLHSYQKMPSVDYIIERVNHKQDGILVKRTFDLGQADEYSNLPDDAKSIICIPISARRKDNKVLSHEKRKNWRFVEREQVLGYLYLDTDKVFNNFDWAAYKTCYALSSLLYVLLDNYHLKITGSIDRLTNVFIRKYVEKKFNSELIKAEIDGSEFAVVMGDIDKFKLVNDNYGHQKGDEVLRVVAEILGNNLRESDIVGRYGGEEFILLLPNTNSKDALAVSEKLRKAIEEAALLGNELVVTMSFGISTYPEHGSTQEELIEKADQALYRAKDTGRNRSVIWNQNIGNNRKRLDKLAGIISGNTTQDHRNVQVIVEIIEFLKERKPFQEKIFEILGRLIEITEAKQGTLVRLDKDKIINMYSRERYKEYWVHDGKINEKILSNVLEKKIGDYYIDWESIHEIDSLTGTPDWQSLIILPIIYQSEVHGILQLSVPIQEKEFDFNHFNFVNSIGGVIGAMLQVSSDETGKVK